MIWGFGSFRIKKKMDSVHVLTALQLCYTNVATERNPRPPAYCSVNSGVTLTVCPLNLVLPGSQ